MIWRRLRERILWRLRRIVKEESSKIVCWGRRTELQYQ
jgi:hypothetical protein